jgi:isochorismate synthase
MVRLRASFEDLIARHLDEAVAQGTIPPLDTAVASRVWFGALNEVLTSWVLTEQPASLEAAYPTVRALLLRGIGAQVMDSAPNVPATSSSGSDLATGAPTAARNLPWSPGLALAGLETGLRAAQQRSRQAGRPVLASLVVPGPDLDPLDFFAQGAGPGGERVFWTRARTGFTLAGVGATWSVEASGPERFSQVRQAWCDLRQDAWVEAPPDTIGVGPILVAGFAFDPAARSTTLWRGFPDGRALLPRQLLTVVDGAPWLTLNVLVEPEANLDQLQRSLATEAEALCSPGPIDRAAGRYNPEIVDVLPAEVWQAAVGAATDQMRTRTGLEKVVLAREVRARGDRPFEPSAVLRHLRSEYPSCFVFGFGQGDGCFVGATPERLVRLRDKLVSTMCLASTIRRGETAEQDRLLGEALLNDPKEREEHDVVVRALRSGLAELCEEVAPIGTPVLLKVRNVQHLLTTIVGRVAEGRDLLDLVERLHPTPAVGGAPRERALALIHSIEQLDRGWYAGPIGWLDARGEGEFSVALRSALLRGAEASLFAGCGIVADSDPAAEYEESRWKLRPVLAALGGEA